MSEPNHTHHTKQSKASEAHALSPSLCRELADLAHCGVLGGDGGNLDLDLLTSG
jgi:hypothetical protein